MASSAPQLYDLRAAHRRVLKQLKVPAINEILPDPDGIKEANPALENVAMSMGRPAAAFPDQDHLAHIKVHLAYAQDPNYGGSPLIGPQFAPHALEHIKQHLTLHYLQSMRAYVAQAAGGEDTLRLHEEKPLTVDDQQALALASQMVSQDSQITFQADQPGIQMLIQKVQQAQQAQREQILNNDPTAQVLLKTQMAETQRKAQEFQGRMQSELQKAQQDYELKVADLQRKVEELQTKYQAQSEIDSQRNATDIALANINNASKERIAEINAGAQIDGLQAQLQHEQDMNAIEAIQAAEQDIRKHGLQIQQANFQEKAKQIHAVADAARQEQVAQAEHDRVMQQQAFQQQNEMMQQEPQQPSAPEQPAAPQSPSAEE